MTKKQSNSNPLMNPKSQSKIAQIMKDFRNGVLNFGGKTITSRDEAKAIAIKKATPKIKSRVIKNTKSK